MSTTNTGAVNHAANLPAMDNADLQIVLGTRLSQYVITQYRRTLPLQLILTIDMDINMCSTTTYLCSNETDLPQLSDSALDSVIPRVTIKPPRTVTFNGFCKGGFETKISKEQLNCINQSDILRQWYQNSLMQAVEDGKQSLMARFYRHLLTEGTHPKNTGMNAGQVSGGQVLGTPSQPVWITPEKVDSWFMALINTVKQMPRVTSVTQEFGASTENMFLFGPAELESVLMKNEAYNSWQLSGDCANCALFKDTFDRMPRGIMPITSYCVESRIIESGGESCKVYPVLFGRRFMGTKASLRVDTSTYDSLDRESVFFKTTFYWHIHTYDCRTMGISWITIDDPQPETKTCGA